MDIKLQKIKNYQPISSFISFFVLVSSTLTPGVSFAEVSPILNQQSHSAKAVSPHEIQSSSEIEIPSGSLDPQNQTLQALIPGDASKNKIASEIPGIHQEIIHVQSVRDWDASKDGDLVEVSDIQAKKVITVKIGTSGPEWNFIEGTNEEDETVSLVSKSTQDYFDHFPEGKSRMHALSLAQEQFPSLAREVKSVRRATAEDLADGTVVPKGFIASHYIEVGLSDGTTVSYLGGADAEHPYFKSMAVSTQTTHDRVAGKPIPTATHTAVTTSTHTGPAYSSQTQQSVSENSEKTNKEPNISASSRVTAGDLSKEKISAELPGVQQSIIHIHSTRDWNADTDASLVELPSDFTPEKTVIVKMGSYGPEFTFIEEKNKEGEKSVIASKSTAAYFANFPEGKSRMHALSLAQEQFGNLNPEVKSVRRLTDSDLKDGTVLHKGFLGSHLIEIKLSDGSTVSYIGGADAEHEYFRSMAVATKTTKNRLLGSRPVPTATHTVVATSIQTKTASSQTQRSLSENTEKTNRETSIQTQSDAVPPKPEASGEKKINQIFMEQKQVASRSYVPLREKIAEIKQWLEEDDESSPLMKWKTALRKLKKRFLKAS